MSGQCVVACSGAHAAGHSRSPSPALPPPLPAESLPRGFFAPPAPRVGAYACSADSSLSSTPVLEGPLAAAGACDNDSLQRTLSSLSLSSDDVSQVGLPGQQGRGEVRGGRASGRRGRGGGKQCRGVLWQRAALSCSWC